MKYSQTNSSGNRAIIKSACFLDAVNGRNPLNISSFSDVLDHAETLVRSEFQPSQGALSNARGSWYEWLISYGAAHFAFENQTQNLFLSLPNIRSYDCARFYKPEIYDLLADLRQKVHDSSGVSLITSNPDFVIVRRLPAYMFDPTVKTEQNLSDLDRLYLMYDQICDLKDISGYASVKTSLRPDRRLQIPHEGSLTKALFRHLQTRLWDVSLDGLKYFAVTMQHTDADKNALNTVATHSLVSVNAKPEAAVDALVNIKCGPDLRSLLSKVCF